MEESSKTFLKHWSGVLVLAIIAAAVLIFLFNLNPIFRAIQNKWTAFKENRLIEKMEDQYKNDRYGGKTPEETFDLFIEALKKEDVELASKYFVIPKQEGWKSTLEQYKTKGLLASFIDELNNNRKSWELTKDDGSTVNFRYSYVIKAPYTEELPLGNGKTQKVTYPSGKFNAEFVFEKYSNGLWKISMI